MAETAWHSGNVPGRVSFVKALRLSHRSLTQGSFSLRTQTRRGVAARVGLIGSSPQPGQPPASESAGDQTQDVEVADQEKTPPTARGATTRRTNYHSTNLMVLGLGPASVCFQLHLASGRKHRPPAKSIQTFGVNQYEMAAIGPPACPESSSPLDMTGLYLSKRCYRSDPTVKVPSAAGSHAPRNTQSST